MQPVDNHAGVTQFNDKPITKGSLPDMSTPNPDYPVLELRVALTTNDYERLVKFYYEGLGIEPAAIWNNDGGRALMLEMGRATLELFDEAQAEVIDQIEVGKRVSGQVRFALQVPDLAAAMERLLAHGATLVHPPVVTPWGDTNVRLQDPDGMQITLFQVADNTEA
jgi:methylmalonyl-CoA/ethylmalonyl-CoA epimerase